MWKGQDEGTNALVALGPQAVLLPNWCLPASPHAPQNVPSGGLDAGDDWDSGRRLSSAKTECVPARMYTESRGGIQLGSANLHGDCGERERATLCKGQLGLGGAAECHLRDCSGIGGIHVIKKG